MTPGLPDQRPTGVWTPAWAIGLIFSVVGFVVGFVGSVRLIEQHLVDIDAHLARLDKADDISAGDRREFAVRLGRIEAALGVDRRGHP